MRSRATILSTTCLLWLIAQPGAAQDAGPDPLITDRPDFTESTATVAPGRVQLEAGYTFSRQDATTVHSIGELLARLGARDGVELRIGLNSYTRVDDGPDVEADGLEDASVGVKISLREPADPTGTSPAVALLIATTLPTGDDELGADGLQPEAKLALAWTLSDRLSLGSNLNAAYPDDGGDGFLELSGSLALGVGLGARAGAFLEAYGFAPEDRPDTGFANGGFTYLLGPDLQLDVRAGIGLDGPRPNYFAGLGAAWRR